MIISELKFSSQELTNAFSVNRFLPGLDSLLSSVMGRGHLKTQAAWLRLVENICSSRKMKVKKSYNIGNVAIFFRIVSLIHLGTLWPRTLPSGSKSHSQQRKLQISTTDCKCINSTSNNLLIHLITTFTWHHILAIRLTNKDGYLAQSMSGQTGSQLWLRGNNLRKYNFTLIKTS